MPLSKPFTIDSKNMSIYIYRSTSLANETLNTEMSTYFYTNKNWEHTKLQHIQLSHQPEIIFLPSPTKKQVDLHLSTAFYGR